MSAPEVNCASTTSRSISSMESTERITYCWIGRVVAIPCRKIVNAVSYVFSTTSRNFSLTWNASTRLSEALNIKEFPVPSVIKEIVKDYYGITDELIDYARKDREISYELLKDAEKVVWLDLTNEDLTNPQIVKLLDWCRNIESLSIIHYPQCFSVLEKITTTKLKHLCIYGVYNECEIDLITANRQLQSLSIKFCNIMTYDAISCILRCDNIHTLKLEWTNLTDDALKMLTGLSKLTHLEIVNNSKVTDIGVAHIGSIKTLRYLKINDIWRDRPKLITYKGIHNLSNLKELECLDIDVCNDIDGSFFELLYPLKKLETLIVYDMYISDRTVRNMKSKIPGLRVIKVVNSEESNIRSLQDLHL